MFPPCQLIPGAVSLVSSACCAVFDLNSESITPFGTSGRDQPLYVNPECHIWDPSWAERSHPPRASQRSPAEISAASSDTCGINVRLSAWSRLLQGGLGWSRRGRDDFVSPGSFPMQFVLRKWFVGGGHWFHGEDYTNFPPKCCSCYWLDCG